MNDMIRILVSRGDERITDMSFNVKKVPVVLMMKKLKEILELEMGHPDPNK